MNLKQLECPACGGDIKMDVNGKNSIFCPFCGKQLAVESNRKEVNVNIHKRYTNDAAVAREKRLEREHRQQLNAEYKRQEDISDAKIFKYMFIFMGVVFICMFGAIGIMNLSKMHAKNSGYIKVGKSSFWMRGDDYKTLSTKLEAAGFTNITTVDLDDAGFILNKADTVESVTIDGESDFEEDDYFPPDAKIVITYH